MLKSIVLSLSVRLLLLAYGAWQDRSMVVKFTDVDYHVFSDAARYVYLGKSPYERETYRYTPILAWLMIPNVYFAEFGKILFIVCDIIAGCMIYMILSQRGYTKDSATFCSQLWLFNPIVFTVSSRGNAESLMAVLVLTTVYCLSSKKQSTKIIGYCVYGLSVHFKIYPIIYSLPIYLRLPNSSNHWLIRQFYPTYQRMLLAACSVTTFGIVTSLCYILYGDTFLEETYLYHISRKDHRHNFSVYFYMLYLLDQSRHVNLLALLVFVPQVLLLVLLSFTFNSDLGFCFFIQTLVFVSFNKVCTSQYFAWFLCLLPLIVPKMDMSLRNALILVALWFLGQGLWLGTAYDLEFEAKNTFIWIWLAGLVFFFINIQIIFHVLQSYRNRLPQDVRLQPISLSNIVEYVTRKCEKQD